MKLETVQINLKLLKTSESNWRKLLMLRFNVDIYYFEKLNKPTKIHCQKRKVKFLQTWLLKSLRSSQKIFKKFRMLSNLWFSLVCFDCFKVFWSFGRYLGLKKTLFLNRHIFNDTSRSITRNDQKSEFFELPV